MVQIMPAFRDLLVDQENFDEFLSFRTHFNKVFYFSEEGKIAPAFYKKLTVENKHMFLHGEVPGNLTGKLENMGEMESTKAPNLVI
jgi:hypothetical protein